MLKFLFRQITLQIVVLTILFISSCGNLSEDSILKFGLLYGTYQNFSHREDKFIDQIDSAMNQLNLDNMNSANEIRANQLRIQYDSNQQLTQRELKMLDTLHVHSDLTELKSNLIKYLNNWNSFTTKCYPLDIKMIANKGLLDSNERNILREETLKFKKSSNLTLELSEQFNKFYNDNDISKEPNKK